MKTLGLYWVIMSICSTTPEPNQITSLVEARQIITDQAKIIQELTEKASKLADQLEEERRYNQVLLEICRKARIWAPTKDDLQTTKKTQRRLDRVLRYPIFLESPMSGNPRMDFSVGQVGVFNNPLSVEEIVDGNNMIVSCALRVFFKGTSAPFWIQGIPTGGLADGASLDYRGPYIVTGTKTYPTITGGQATLFLLEPFHESFRSPQLQSPKK